MDRAGAAAEKPVVSPFAFVAALVTAVCGVAIPAAAAPPATHGLGLRPVKHVQAQLPQRPRLTTAALPASVDLSPWTVPVGNQGSLNSCVTWAIDYAMLGWYSRRDGHAGQPFAPMYAYSQIQALHGWADGGAYVEDAYQIAEQQGVDPQADYPQGNYDWRTQPTAAQRVTAATHKTVGYALLYATWPKPAGDRAQAAIENALATGHPVALSIPVYQPFEQLNAAQHLMTAASVTSSSPLGYHEVLAVGYDGTGVRIQNSWGTGWGDRGFADLGWDFVDQYSLDASVMTGFADSTETPPAISTVSPGTGPAGTSVVIRGLALGAATGVTFGTVPAVFTIVDDTTIVATAPPATGAMEIHVTGPTGTSISASPAVYTYPAPQVRSLSAASGTTAGGTVVTLTGTALAQVAAVRFGSSAAAVISHDDTTLKVVAPAHGPGTVDVTLLPGGVTAGHFQYVAPPAVIRITRVSARILEIRGSNLSAVRAVKVGSRNVTIVSVTQHRVRVRITSGRRTLRVQLKTPYGIWSGTWRR